MENTETEIAQHEEIQASTLQPAPQQPLKIGETLKQARLASGWDIEQVANHLHLKPRVVEQIEADDYSLARSQVFIKGYLRSYCKLVGVDTNAILEAFDALHLPEKVSNVSSQGPFLRHMKGQMFSVKAASAVILAVLGLMIVLGWQMGDDDSQHKSSTASVISPYTMGNSISMQATPVVPPPVVVAEPSNMLDFSPAPNTLNAEAAVPQQTQATTNQPAQSAAAASTSTHGAPSAVSQPTHSMATTQTQTGSQTAAKPANTSAAPTTQSQRQLKPAITTTDDSNNDAQNQEPQAASTSNSVSATSRNNISQSAQQSRAVPQSSAAQTASKPSHQAQAGDNVASSREAVARKKLQPAEHTSHQSNRSEW